MRRVSRLSYVVAAITFLFSVYSPASTHAAGSGAGTQSTEATLDALEAVQNADTVSEVKVAVQDFLDQYDLAYSTDAFSHETVTASGLNEADFANLRLLSYELIQEWSKYTVAWVAATNLDTIYASKDVKVGPPSPSQKRCTSYGFSVRFLVFDVACMFDGGGSMRGAFTHEYAHYFLYNRFGSHTFDVATWNSYNTAGFSYGAGGASTYGTAFLNREHPQLGFVSSYAMTGMEEDQADIFAYLFGTAQYQKLNTWIPGDSNLQQKVNRMKAFLASVDANMNDAYFQALYDYAKDQPGIEGAYEFEGPGTRSFDPHNGEMFWFIPEGETTTSGTSIGGEGMARQTLVLDGSIKGGWFSVVIVEKNGILKGTGFVEVFIEVKEGGILAPGHSPGCMTSGDLTVAGTYQAEIGGPIACAEYDQMKVTGEVNLTGGTLEALLLNSYIPKAGESYMLIDNDGTDLVTGTFNGLPEGATFELGGAVLRITYVGGTGNDIVLSVVSTPGAPDTGLGLLSSQPLRVALMMVSAGAGLMYMSMRYKQLQAKKK